MFLNFVYNNDMFDDSTVSIYFGTRTYLSGTKKFISHSRQNSTE